MKVLLTNVPWYEEGVEGFLGVRAGSRWPHKWPFTKSMKIGYRPFPFFMATAFSLLKNAKYDVIMRDSIEEGDTYDKFYGFVEKNSPEILMMETSTPSLTNDLKVAENIKKIIPDCKIIFTGLHVEVADPFFLDKYSFIDFTIYGEYEMSLLYLIRALSEKSELEKVPAITYRVNGKVRKNERGEVVPMANLPWPERDCLPKDYFDAMNGLEEPQLQVHSSRGCPYHCNFCVWPQLVYGNHLYRMREPQDIVDEILANMQKVNYKSIYFDDDAININKQHILELCKLMKANGLDKIKWGCMARGDLMDDEILAALKDAGCHSVKYGVETFNQEILDKTGKSMNIEKNVENIRKTREKYGMKVHLTYCLGLVGDTEETVTDTIEKALALDADSRQFSIATPYPGSQLWDIYKGNGWIASDSYDNFDGHNTAVVDQDGITGARLAELRQYAENEDAKQQAKRVPQEFEDIKNLEEIVDIVGHDKSILITCTSRRAIINCLYKLLAKNNDVYVLTGEEWADALVDVPNDKKIIMPKGSRITKECILDYRNKKVDVAVIPTRGSSLCGYSNVLEAMEKLTDKVCHVTEYANINVL